MGLLCQGAELSVKAAVAQCKCSMSTCGSPGMLRKKGIFLAVARWDRTGAAQSWCHGQSLLLATCSVAKEPWNLNKHMKCSQNNLSVSDFSVLSVRKTTWEDTILQFL